MTRSALVVDMRRDSEFTSRWVHATRPSWGTEIVRDERAARTVIGARPIELVVVAGAPVEVASVLSYARTKRPAALRVVVLDDGRWATGPEISLSHQATRSPTDDSAMANLLRIVNTAAGLLDSEDLRDAVGRLGDIPALSSTIVQLDRLLEDPDVAMQDVADQITQDVALAAEVVRLVNTPYFGLARRITDIGEAVAFLGLATIRSLALGVEVFRTLDLDLDASYVERLFQHGLAAAGVAASLVGPAHRSDAFCAGLLHVVGDLALEDLDLGASIRRQADQTGTPRSELEAAALGATHEQVGAYLLLRWGLPLEVVSAVASHHAPTHSDDDDVALDDVAEAVRHGCRTTTSVEHGTPIDSGIPG